MSEETLTETQANSTRIAFLEGKIGALDEGKQPWLKKPGTVISILAFIFSLASFGYSATRDFHKDEALRESDLHSTISQLNSLTEKWAELYLQYQSNPGFSTLIVPTLKTQINLLATKAYSLLSESKASVSALDLAIVANALQNNGNYQLSTQLLERAVKVAQSPAEYLIVSQMLGNYGFYRGDIEMGDKYYKLAGQVYNKFPQSGQTKEQMNYTLAANELAWAASVARLRCGMVEKHFKKLANYLTGMQPAVQNALNQMKVPILQECPNFASNH